MSPSKYNFHWCFNSLGTAAPTYLVGLGNLKYGKSLEYSLPTLLTFNAWRIEKDEKPAPTPVSTTVFGFEYLVKK